MSNKNRRGRKTANSTKMAVTPITLPLRGTPLIVDSTQPQPNQWKSRLRTTWSHLGGVACILSIVAIGYTHRQTNINKEQLEELRRQNDLAEYAHLRSTGGIPAKMEFAQFSPAPSVFSKDMRIDAFGGIDKPYFKDIATLIKFRPTLVLNNVGEEPIEAIKVVTRLISADIDLPKQSLDKNEFGLVVREVDREEIGLSKQWLPETAIEISLLKGILGQMVQIQNRVKQDRMHKAMMEVQITAKITGSNVFDRDDDRQISCSIWWMPSGFPRRNAVKC